MMAVAFTLGAMTIFLVGMVAGAALALPRHRASCPPVTTPPQPQGVIDHVRLLADLRAGKDEQIAEAYRITFGGQIGRFVLTHWMAQCGVGGRQGAGMTPDDRAYMAGRHDAAVQLMSTAGFDQSSAVLASLTDQLGDMDHDRHDGSQHGYAATGFDADDV